MPSTKNHRRGDAEKNKKGRLKEKASSFHGRSADGVVAEMLPRPRTVPDLLSGRRPEDPATMKFPAKLTKLLLNVTVQRSPGALHVLMPPEATVRDLIAAALGEYVKEGRRPFLQSGRASGFDLHYSQFSLEILDRDKKVIELGSRKFFLCPHKPAVEATTVASDSSCSKEAEDQADKGFNCFKFIDFHL